MLTYVIVCCALAALLCTILLYIEALATLGTLEVLVILESVVNLRRLRIALSNFRKHPKLFIPNAPNVANNPQKFTIFQIF